MGSRYEEARRHADPRREIKPSGDVVECAVCEYILPRADLPKCGWRQVGGKWVCWLCKR
jgi:hypothetical protein